DGGGLEHLRLWSKCVRGVAIVGEAPGERKYLDDLRAMSQCLVGTIGDSTGTVGRNLQRGYFSFGEPKDAVTQPIHLFFLTEMNSLAVNEAMRVLPAGDPLREELRDYLTGVAWFTLEEALIDPQAPGYPYEYLAAAANPNLGKRGDQTGLLLAPGYEQTGDVRFIARARPLARPVSEYQHRLRASELATHVCIYRWLHRNECGHAFIEPRAEHNSDDTWTLAWETPPGARQTIVHWGEKRLVPYLGFDPGRRMFRI